MAAIDIPEVQHFMAMTPPFSSLSSVEQKQVLKGVSMEYIRQGEALSLIDDRATLYLIRRGACEIRNPQGGLVDQIADGECFGVSSVLAHNPDGLQVVAMEDSLVYRFNKTHFTEMLEQNEAFGLFFEYTRHHRQRKLSLSQKASPLKEPDPKEPSQDNPTQLDPTSYSSLSTPITHLMSRSLVTAAQGDTVQKVAAQMTQARVSSVLLLDEQGLSGIVTDRDLRSRVLALGGTANMTIGEIMTAHPVCLSADTLMIQAQLVMSEHNIHHLPVVDDNNTPIGIVTVTDLLRQQELSPLLLINQIQRQKSLEDLVEVCQQWPAFTMKLVTTEMKPTDVGKVLATVSDQITRKLIALALEQYGCAPMAFQFLVFGSQARKDQSLGSDQDNGLMLEREPNEVESAYFATLCDYICQGLAACGIRLCPGNIMASNPQWRLTKTRWQQTFNQWVKSSTPNALLHASIFFDIRCVYGDPSPVNDVITSLQDDIAKNSLFLATLTRNALSSKPPLGFFRHFLLESSGEHKHQLDLKHQGLALVNDLARLYGLSCQHYQVGTLARLEQAVREKHLSEDIARNLMDAWSALNSLRFDAQSRCWQAKGEASAYLDPSSLSPLERKHLKVTFSMIREAQEVAQQHFLRGYS
ncbi:DUF294 nucleotidyltransferase-like domain-containing protein [Marinomonas algarum]|uniref:DUF294 nucleotidyltransferase-like domain-containing protein n=1 Tax=Marinomonas algarum TaxID=2883105 RepID=A0A9X1IKT8_9GAMM|nr:DUF294 nucleotidyltransferase-like domain-containing protein [Marinomonas algarum]MCB5161103.1 DUF294 nucleotidyltransferase-like domain-containing protein [Marinomonas algarum]